MLLDRTVKSFFAVSFTVIAILAITNLIVTQETGDSGNWTLFLLSLGGSVVFWVLLWLDERQSDVPAVYEAANAAILEAGGAGAPLAAALADPVPVIPREPVVPAEPIKPPVPAPQPEPVPVPDVPPVPVPEAPQPSIEEPVIEEPNIEAPTIEEPIIDDEMSVSDTGLEPSAPPADAAAAYIAEDNEDAAQPVAVADAVTDSVVTAHADEDVLTDLADAAQSGDDVAEQQVAEAMAAPVVAADVAETVVSEATEAVSEVMTEDEDDDGGVVLPVEGDADNLMLVEGIGPKYNAALQAASIATYETLSNSPREALVTALQTAGYTRIPASIDTWAEQAGYLLRGDREGLEALQKVLIAGRRAE